MEEMIVFYMHYRLSCGSAGKQNGGKEEEKLISTAAQTMTFMHCVFDVGHLISLLYINLCGFTVVPISLALVVLQHHPIFNESC